MNLILEQKTIKPNRLLNHDLELTEDSLTNKDVSKNVQIPVEKITLTSYGIKIF